MRRSLICFLFLMSVISTCFGQGILDKPVDCTFNNPVGEVFASLAKQAGTGISVDPAVVGQINIALGQVPLKRALEEVCRLSKSYPGILSEGSIVIASGDPKGPYYGYIAKIEVVKIKYQKVADLMIKLSKHPLVGYLTPSPAFNEVSIIGPPDIIEQVKKQIETIDIKKLMIETQLAVLDTSNVNLGDKGVNWEKSVGPANSNGVKTLQFNNMVLGYSNTMNGKILFQLLDTESKDNLKILSEPSVTVTDGEPATIFFGKKTFIQQYVLSGTNMGAVTAPTAIESGVKLEVTPTAIDELDPVTNTMVKKVQVVITAEVSEIVGTGSQGLPVTNNRKVTTVLTVLSGETIIIGGLKTSLEYKLKGGGGGIFRYIPIINLLFRSSRTEKRDQVISVLITPTVLPRPQEKKELESTKGVVEERKPDTVTPRTEEKTPSSSNEKSVAPGSSNDGGDSSLPIEPEKTAPLVEGGAQLNK